MVCKRACTPKTMHMPALPDMTCLLATALPDLWPLHCADDPYWWHEEQIRLLRGTRLGRAVVQHSTGLRHLAGWVQRLEQICRLVAAMGAALGALCLC